MNKTILFSATFLVLAGCGIKGPPLPPLQEATVQMQKTADDIEKTTPPSPELKNKKSAPKKKAKLNEN